LQLRHCRARFAASSIVTVSRLTAAVQAETPAAAAAALRARGMRVSSARRELLEALFAADAPLSAEELAGDGDVASAYRNLEVLEDVGLVRHVHLGHGPGLYHPAGLEREFVVCEACGAVRAVAPAELDAVRAAVLDAVGYRARFAHFPLAGLCPACAAKGGA
jgi:Fur family transcriptional regulator, ferric uptake regulator